MDLSEAMLKAARRRFAAEERVEVKHYFNLRPPPSMGEFEATVPGFAIHQCPGDRQRALQGEMFEHLAPGGVFCNLEHVASPTAALHHRFLSAVGLTPETEDRSNELLEVETHLRWLREIGFTDADCY